MATTVATRQVIDKASGEVLVDELEVTHRQRVESRPWVRLYLDAWVTIKGLTGITAQTLDVLYLLLRLLPAAYEGDNERPVIAPSTYHKDMWAKQLNTSRAVINKHLQRLVSQGVIKRVARGAYLVNPQLIGYGTSTNIEKLSRIYGTFEVSADGATIEPVFEIEDDVPTPEELDYLTGGDK